MCSSMVNLNTNPFFLYIDASRVKFKSSNSFSLPNQDFGVFDLSKFLKNIVMTKFEKLNHSC